MGSKKRGILTFVLTLFILGGFSLSSDAQEKQALTLSSALEQVFTLNPNVSLFLKEQKLVGKREGLTKHPTLKLSATPGEIINGDWQNPRADLTATMSLLDSLTLKGSLDLKLDQSGVDVEPGGSLTLNYNLLGTPGIVEKKLSQEDDFLQYENALVLKTFNLLADLRERLDEETLAQERLKLLEDHLEASKFVPDYDDLKLKKDLREQKSKLLDLQDVIAQLQLELASHLGATEGVLFDPHLKVHLFELNLAESLYLKQFADTSTSLQGARIKLENTQKELDYERKTAGWNLDASGKVSLDQTWNLKLSASKDLYPRQIILEELELQVAKAEQEFKTAEKSLKDQLKSTLQNIKSSKKQVELQKEQLADARADLELRERQFAADLVTEFQVRETKFELRTKELDYSSAQLAWGKSVLKLWEQCGYNLFEEIRKIIS